MRVNIENATKQAKYSDVSSKIYFANQTMKMCKDFVTQRIIEKVLVAEQPLHMLKAIKQ